MKNIINYIKKNFTTSIIIAVLFFTTVFSASALHQKNKFIDNSLNSLYQKSFFDLSNSLYNIDIALSKALITSDINHFNIISNEIQRECSYSKACLSNLPISDTTLSKTYKFLAQTGDYINSLSLKTIYGINITEEEEKNLTKLSQYATKISDNVIALEDKLLNNSLSFNDEKFLSVNAKDSEFSISNIENHFENYPTLIYDGPFSDHIYEKESEFLKSKEEVSKNEAKKIAAAFLNEKNIEDNGETKGAIKTYNFKVVKSKNETKYIEITKYGGYVISYFNSKNINDEKISIDKVKKISSDFLEKNNFTNLKTSYYEKRNGVITINYFPEYNSLYLYPDLIKVNVSLDNGEIVGFDCKNYISNHKKRTDIIPSISYEKAKEKLKLTPLSSSLCLIPTNNGNEILCYEFKINSGNKNFLIYINAHTGVQEKTLILIENENGTLTI